MQNFKAKFKYAKVIGQIVNSIYSLSEAFGRVEQYEVTVGSAILDTFQSPRPFGRGKNKFNEKKQPGQQQWFQSPRPFGRGKNVQR